MALLVMTVGLLGLLQSVNVAYQQNLRDKLRREATQIAEERMHDWCRLPFDRITSGGERKEEASEKLVGGSPWRFTVFRERHKVGGAAVDPRSDSKKLAVKVTWFAKGTEYQHEIFALRSRRRGE